MLSNYVREVWVGESPPENEIDTVKIVDALIEGDDILAELHSSTLTKLENLITAMNNILVLDEILENYDFFTLEFAKKIHSTIGKDLIESPGLLRTKAVRATNSSVKYATPMSIEEKLVGLFDFIRSAASQAPDEDALRCTYMIRLGSFFFSEFLLIHPFSNGNGRTARILLQAFLRNFVLIPFSLYVSNRDEYIKVLERRNDLSPPSALARYVLLACNRTASPIKWLAMTYSEKGETKEE